MRESQNTTGNINPDQTDAQQQLNRMQQLMERYMASMNAVTERLTQMSVENANLQQQHENYQQHIASTRADLDRAQAHLVRMGTALEDQTSVNGRLLNELEVLRDQLREKENQILVLAMLAISNHTIQEVPAPSRARSLSF